MTMTTTRTEIGRIERVTVEGDRQWSESAHVIAWIQDGLRFHVTCDFLAPALSVAADIVTATNLIWTDDGRDAETREMLAEVIAGIAETIELDRPYNLSLSIEGSEVAADQIEPTIRAGIAARSQAVEPAESTPATEVAS